MEEAALYEAQISLRVPFSKALSAGSNTKVVIDRSRIMVSSKEIHEVIVVDV
jgi:hypothetical protein